VRLVLARWKMPYLNLCSRLAVGSVKIVSLESNCIIIGPTVLQLSGEREIRNVKSILISEPKFG
jgi:hypothetical protein